MKVLERNFTFAVLIINSKNINKYLEISVLIN